MHETQQYKEGWQFASSSTRVHGLINEANDANLLTCLNDNVLIYSHHMIKCIIVSTP